MRTFESYPNKDELFFILPSVWRGRGRVIRPKKDLKIQLKYTTSWAPFYHSKYPVIRGMLKGWIPFCGWTLFTKAHQGDVLLSMAEPNLLTAYFYGWLSRIMGLKHVCLTWQNVHYDKRLSGMKLKITEWLLRKNFEMSAGVLFGTETAYNIHREYLSKNKKFAIIPQAGVDTDIEIADIKDKFVSEHNLKGKVLYLFAAMMDERKGVSTTINAFKESLKEVHNGFLIMVGSGKLLDSAKDLVSELGIEDKVLFTGLLPYARLLELLKIADMLVHPSEPYKNWEEQFGWIFLQAESLKLPVISTAIGCIHETVRDGISGILVPPKDVPALSRAMVKLAKDENLRKKMGEAGREFVLSKFSHAKVAEGLYRFLHSL